MYLRNAATCEWTRCDLLQRQRCMVWCVMPLAFREFATCSIQKLEIHEFRPPGLLYIYRHLSYHVPESICLALFMVQRFWYSSNVLLLLLGGRSCDGPCVHKRGSTLHQRRPDWQHDTHYQYHHFHGVKASPSPTLPFSIDLTVSPSSLFPPPYVVFPRPDPLPLTLFCPFHFFYAPCPFFTKLLPFFFFFFFASCFHLFPVRLNLTLINLHQPSSSSNPHGTPHRTWSSRLPSSPCTDVILQQQQE